MDASHELLAGKVSATGNQAAAAAVSAKPKRVRRVKEARQGEYPRPQVRKKSHKKKTVQEMDEAVQRLKMEMQALEERRQTLALAVNSRESHVAMIGEFFRLFRNGIAMQTPALIPAEQPSLDTQLGFVDSRFHHNVRSADGFGVSTFVGQLRNFSLVHDDVRLDLLRVVEIVDSESVTTVQFVKRLMMTVTDTTIQYVFPHLLRPENHSVMMKLVGQPLSFFANASFVFDETGAVIEAEWTVDFVTGMLAVLTLQEVAVVLQQAHIIRDAYLPNGPETDDRLERVSPKSTAHTQATQGKKPAATSQAVVVQRDQQKTEQQVSQRKREQWRRNQSRYRKQRMSTIGDLEVDVARLQMDILHLEAQRRTLYEAVNTRESTVGVVTNIFRHFNDSVSSRTTALMLAEPEPECPQTHRDLCVNPRIPQLSSTATAKSSGFESFLDQMYRFSLLKDVVQVDLLRCVEISATETSKIVEVVQRIHLTVSDTSINHIFPQLQRPKCSRIKKKLFGQQLCFLANAFFVFDEVGAVADVQWTIDFVTGLQAVLTLEETVIVLQATGDLHEEREDVDDEGEEHWKAGPRFNGFLIPSNPLRSSQTTNT